PIAEEVIFMGWLYGKLRSRMGMIMAIFITSVLFCIIQGQWNVGVNVFAMSIVLCGLREVTGTIYAGILLHMVKNGIAFYLLYVMGMG
ncbi:CPBP family intramembrane metalloprotease, partial [Candidatus Saccharibacteria bacterium]|nr:CPBP family intramembrane metalloprotease [Candidatus Saccharibacteria bacterium]